ncbi:protein KlaA [Pseudomonas syringae pv. coryli]|uniref:protein KlaA n=1 Tax=Pseudomonas syringae pv. coryli TaxID=317659 RepID=UPI003D2D3CB1
MSYENVSVETLKADVLPALFREPSTIGEYGAVESNAGALDEFSNLMEGGAVTALAIKISQIVASLSDADPQKIVEKPSWVARVLGGNVETKVRYQVARKSLETQLEEAQGVAQRVRDTLRSLDQMMIAHQSQAERVRLYIVAGREYLDENPDAGVYAAGSMEFDRPRERFARKLANLETLLSSHGMSVTQMKLTRAQAVDMLDRFSETASVLVPVWRQHTLALITTKNMSPELVAEATRAHSALMRSLSSSLEVVKH